MTIVSKKSEKVFYCESSCEIIFSGNLDMGMSQAYNVNTCPKGKCNLSNSCEGFSLLKSLQTFSSFGGKHESKDGMGLNQPNIRLILNHFSSFTINLQFFFKGIYILGKFIMQSPSSWIYEEKIMKLHTSKF